MLYACGIQTLTQKKKKKKSSAAPDSARRASAGSTIDGWMKSVKSNGRVEVPVEVLELARQDFLAERVSDDQASPACEAHTRFNADSPFRRSKQ